LDLFVSGLGCVRLDHGLAPGCCWIVDVCNRFGYGCAKVLRFGYYWVMDRLVWIVWLLGLGLMLWIGVGDWDCDADFLQVAFCLQVMCELAPLAWIWIPFNQFWKYSFWKEIHFD